MVQVHVYGIIYGAVIVERKKYLVNILTRILRELLKF